MALTSACAGPSWTSWARRTRSASRASTIRIRRSSGQVRRGRIALQAGVAALQEEPRALQAADRQLESGELGRALAQLAPTERRRCAAARRCLRLARRGSVARVGGERLDFRAVQLVVLLVPRREVAVVRLAIALGQAAQRVRGVAERGLCLRVQAVEGLGPDVAGVDLGAHLRRSIRAAHGQATRYTRNGSGAATRIGQARPAQGSGRRDPWRGAPATRRAVPSRTT